MQGEESVQEGAQFQMIREKSEAAWRRFQDEKMNQKNPQGSLNGKRRTYRHPGLPNDSDDGFETDIKYFVKTLYTTCKTHCPSAETKGNITGRTFPKGTWVLTYDDGPKDSRSRAILDHLNDHGMKGTFFWLTKALKSTSGKNLGKEVLDEGHELANHSETHADLSKSSADLNREISKTQSFFAKEFGHTPKFFRLPYGAGAKNGSAARKKIAAEKMIHIFWNVDTLDWKDKVPSSIFQRAKKQMLIEGRGVVLFHDIHSQSVSASNMLVDWIASHSSFKVKPLSVVIDSLNQ
jgi:peptidoglycan/xylan/chitin deacetylase (PgdA/CDA1 family)